jgi:hypothetical protein
VNAGIFQPKRIHFWKKEWEKIQRNMKNIRIKCSPSFKKKLKMKRIRVEINIRHINLSGSWKQKEKFNK